MNKKLIYILIFVIIFGSIIFCVVKENALKNNKLYTAENDTSKKDMLKINSTVNSEGSTNFYDISSAGSLNSNDILLTISPDKKYAMYMSLLSESDNVIMGRTSTYVNLSLKELSSGTIINIAGKFPFITSVKWNRDGTYASLIGSDSINLFSLKDKKFILRDKLGKLNAINAGWSPDGKKLYIEYSNLINGAILDISSLTLVQSYETKENMFIKDFIDNNYFLATTEDISAAAPFESKASTIIMDRNANKIASFEAVYRDKYKKSLLLQKENGCIAYINNYTSSANPSYTSTDNIFDAKFIYDGSFVYLTMDNESFDNEFILHLVNIKGAEISKLRVSGSSIFIRPDGKLGYINGPKKEVISFQDSTMEMIKSSTAPADELHRVVNKTVSAINSSIINNRMVSCPTLTPAVSNQINSIIKTSNFKAVPLKLNPEERVVITAVQNLSPTEVQYDIKLEVRFSWLLKEERNYKLQLVRSNGSWFINKITVLH